MDEIIKQIKAQVEINFLNIKDQNIWNTFTGLSGLRKMIKMKE